MSSIHRTIALLLAILMAWSGMAFAYHVEAQASDESAVVAKHLPDHDQSSEVEKSCHLCGHLLAQQQAIHVDMKKYVPQAAAGIKTWLSEPAGLLATPPPTPPPQA